MLCISVRECAATKALINIPWFVSLILLERFLYVIMSDSQKRARVPCTNALYQCPCTNALYQCPVPAPLYQRPAPVPLYQPPVPAPCTNAPGSVPLYQCPCTNALYQHPVPVPLYQCPCSNAPVPVSLNQRPVPMLKCPFSRLLALASSRVAVLWLPCRCHLLRILCCTSCGCLPQLCIMSVPLSSSPRLPSFSCGMEGCLPIVE